MYREGSLVGTYAAASQSLVEAGYKAFCVFGILKRKDLKQTYM